MTKRLAIAGILAASLAVASSAIGEDGAVDAAAGTVLLKDGKALMERGQIAEGCAKIEAADKLLHTAGMLLSLADCREKNGQLATAYGLFEEAGVLARQKNDEDRDAEAKRRAALLEPRLARVQLDMAAGNRGVGATVKRDGHEIPEAAWDTPTPIDPGEHLFEVSAPGKVTWRGAARIGAVSGTTRIPVPLLEAQTSAPAGPEAAFWNGQRIAGVTVGSVGVVGLVVGAVFGARAISKTNDAKPDCSPTDPGFCNDTGVALRGDAKTAGNVSTGAIVAGGVLVAGGIVLLAVPPSTPAKAPQGARVEVVVPSIGTIEVRGRF
jgi:hypothetical protein